METCSAPTCSRAPHARGLCTLHYQRWRSHGSLDDPTKTTAEKFWSHVTKDPSGCWMWAGATSKNGYGQFRASGNALHYAHRFAYEMLVGPIPDGLQLDHLCRKRACVRPEHLEPVTQAENIRRSDLQAGRARWLATITNCPQGHPYDEANTRIDARGARVCRECQRIKARERYWRLKDETEK